MGVVRAKERGPFSIRDVMTRQDELVTLPTAYEVSDILAGESIFKDNCGACHPGLSGDAFALARQRHPDPLDLATYLRDPAAFNKAMPPYEGVDEAMKILVAHMLDLPIDQVQVR